MSKKQRPFKDFYSAWWWLHEHPCMKYRGEVAQPEHDSAFPNNLDIFLAIVNPKTDKMEDDETLNTVPEIWLEVSTYTEQDPKNPEWYDRYEGASRHDYWLDTGGKTFERAIIKLAMRVWKFYGDLGRPHVGVWPKDRKSQRVLKNPQN